MSKFSVFVRNIQLGGGAPVRIQSMTKCPTDDIPLLLREIKTLEKAGCEIVRIAIPNHKALESIPILKTKTTMPIVADIHFDYKLAIAAIKRGVDKIRINPGNIGARWKIEEIISVAKDFNVPVRIGVNAGSLSKEILKKYGRPTPQALVFSLEEQLKIFEKKNFYNLVLSAKTTNPQETIEVYESLNEKFPYPLHLGVTESGLPLQGAVRSTSALAILLYQGIGDTIRISLTGPAVLEVIVAKELLQSLGLRVFGPQLISCPVCGRCKVNLIKIAQRVERKLQCFNSPIKVAVMGCVVNGPGEARFADYGIACGKKSGVIFKKGKVLKKCPEDELAKELIATIKADL
ncbi:MAG: flavodoxin-dependent (E)-4-hydroxy-3-methylbut-2-enyl-diphosphate synthase [candidate division WOR-3 bacterium]|nr:flavodoxin-dependent (E)-4-hydroxy-3-methylbut-2-enyl-diphosphate synthase [candidate division WOR-3 bacterium]MCX7757486.1 flavodoxin-dependent (E)-4-hydroxy-3-methylbut-2-enyl-diphosphate synthase [candidate division WOR-3 bacterium]MDW7987135.1 flavodoxin-dependent (E)-4-hydroxy-3-methylbut-2-enyl-diphosphate synthase [candidate division WOR-3 bacterium]